MARCCVSIHCTNIQPMQCQIGPCQAAPTTTELTALRQKVLKTYLFLMSKCYVKTSVKLSKTLMGPSFNCCSCSPKERRKRNAEFTCGFPRVLQRSPEFPSCRARVAFLVRFYCGVLPSWHERELLSSRNFLAEVPSVEMQPLSCGPWRGGSVPSCGPWRRGSVPCRSPACFRALRSRTALWMLPQLQVSQRNCNYGTDPSPRVSAISHTRFQNGNDRLPPSQMT
jgi:hypothetical protein